MSETKEQVQHTPGPWHVGAGNGIGSVFGPEGHRAQMTDDGTALAPICMMVRGFGGLVHRDKFPPEDEANAQLIAAAPDLLDACEETLFKLETMTTEEYQQGGDKSIRLLLNQVIAKTKGE